MELRIEQVTVLVIRPFEDAGDSYFVISPMHGQQRLFTLFVCVAWYRKAFAKFATAAGQHAWISVGIPDNLATVEVPGLGGDPEFVEAQCVEDIFASRIKNHRMLWAGFIKFGWCWVSPFRKSRNVGSWYPEPGAGRVFSCLTPQPLLSI